MNQRQALTEARRRWGKRAIVEQNDQYSAHSRCMVGVVLGGMMFEIKGRGATFAAAFRDVDTQPERARLFNEAKGQPCPICGHAMQSDVYTDSQVRHELGVRRWEAMARDQRAKARYMHWPKVLEHEDGTFYAVCSVCSKQAEDSP